MAGMRWRNLALRVLSVLLAILLWIYATNEQNPQNDQILSIQLHRLNPPQGVEVSGLPTNISIRVQGPRTQVAALTAVDFQAVVDLSGVIEGEQYIPVKVNAPTGIQVVQVTPPRVHVVVDSVVEKQVNVAAVLKGNPGRGYNALDPVIQPDKVILRGPRSKVAAIDQVKVTVEVESATRPVEQTLPLNPGQGIGVTPQSVKVSVPVIPMPAKTLAVRAVVNGDPAPGFETLGVTVSPANVQVVAPSNILAGLSGVDTEKIDLKGAERDLTVKIGITPPPGVVELNPNTVEVTIRIKKKEQPAPAVMVPPARTER